MTKRGLLFVVSGPSGVGKDTVLEECLRHADTCVRSVSATTRAPRPNERHGLDYFFVSKSEFEQYIADGSLLEYAEYNGNYYGTPQKKIQEMLSLGKNIILKIEVQGAAKVKQLIPDAISVFIVPPSWQELERRIRRRETETEEAVLQRLAIAREELALAAGYDYIIINDDVLLCANRLCAILCAEPCKAAYMQNFISEVINNA